MQEQSDQLLRQSETTTTASTRQTRVVNIRTSTNNFLRSLLSVDDDNSAHFHREAQRVWYDAETCASIYLGPRSSGRQPNLAAVVNCTKMAPCPYSNIAYCQVAVNDTEAADILSYLSGATMFMDSHLRTSTLENPRSILVHCEAGVSRSATVVVAYLVRYHNMSPTDALEHIRQSRPIVQPNRGFQHQLELFFAQNNLSTNGAVVTVAGNPIDARWIRSSTAIYATCRNMKDHDHHRLIHECFNALRQSDGFDREKFLFHALDYLWGRGVLQVEVDWLAEACRALGEGSAEIVERLLTDEESSQFCEQWAGEVYPRWVGRVLSAVMGEETE